MTNLVPERRTDRNGKTVIRWVKPSAKQSSIGFPSPSVPATVSFPKLYDEARRVMTGSIFTIPDEIDSASVQLGLRRLPTETAGYLESLIGNCHSDNYLMALTISALHNSLPASVVDDVAYLYAHMDTNHFDPDTYSGWTKREGIESLHILTSALRGCSLSQAEGFHYEYGAKVPMRLHDDDTASKVVAVFNTMGALSDATFTKGEALKFDLEADAEWFTDHEFAQFIVDNHEKNGPLLTMIQERETIDLEVLRLFIESEAPSLSSGLL